MALYILISVLLGVKSKARVDTSYLNGNGKKCGSGVSLQDISNVYGQPNLVGIDFTA
jgi:hypothetical protein